METIVSEQPEIVRAATTFAGVVRVMFLALSVTAGCTAAAPSAVSAPADASADACTSQASPPAADSGAQWHWTTRRFRARFRKRSRR